MTLVCVLGNTHLNPHCVGKVTFDVTVKGNLRLSTTTVFDRTGQNVLARFETTISLERDNPDKNAIIRDSFIHAEIIRAIKSGEDARKFDESSQESAK